MRPLNPKTYGESPLRRLAIELSIDRAASAHLQRFFVERGRSLHPKKPTTEAT